MSRSWLNIMTFGLALIFVGCGSETSGSQSEMDAEIATDAVVIQDMSADVGSVDVDADIDAMCRQLLANTVIENYRVEKA